VLRALLANEVRRARTFPIPSLEGHTLLFGAIVLLHRNSTRDSDRSRELLEAIIERYPRHPGARAWLAKWHVMRAHQGWSADPMRSASMARDDTNRALDLDPDNGLALTIDGLVHVQFEKNLDVGELRYRRAIEVSPSESLAWLLKGALHAFRGEGEIAVADTQRAMRLSPLDPMRYYYESLAATAAAAAGEFERAIELASHSLRENCNHTSTLRTLVISQAMLGRLDEARASAERLLALEPQFTVSRFRDRSPGASYAIGQRFADALSAAGVPE
jgi:tetratricopeptide (TPR) repeat protein